MLRALLAVLCLALPVLAEELPNFPERLERLRGTQVELFESPQGPDVNAPTLKVWTVSFASAVTPGVFEVTLTQGWRGKIVPEIVPPPPRTFKLAVSKGPCGSSDLKGVANEDPELALQLTSHLTRMCEDLPLNEMIGFLTVGKPNKDGTNVTRLYQAPIR